MSSEVSPPETVGSLASSAKPCRALLSNGNTIILRSILRTFPAEPFHLTSTAAKIEGADIGHLAHNCILELSEQPGRGGLNL